MRLVHTGEDGLAVDLLRRRGGRGLNLHPTRACVALAFKKNALSRGFRRAVPASAQASLVDQLGAAFAERLTGYLRGAAQRGGVPLVGPEEPIVPPALGEWLRALEKESNTEPSELRVGVAGPRMTRHIAWLAAGALEFTFARAGGM